MAATVSKAGAASTKPKTRAKAGILNANSRPKHAKHSSSSSDSFEFSTQPYTGVGSQTYESLASSSQNTGNSQAHGMAPAVLSIQKGKQKATDDPPPPLRPNKRYKTDNMQHKIPLTQDQQIAVTEAETPMIKRNIAMRSQADASASNSNSEDNMATNKRGRGRRASSIGSGFEALPHPSLADDTLYRHIDPSESEATRFTTIASWAATRAKDRLLAEETHSALADAIQDQARRIALHIVDDFIDDVQRKIIDLSFPIFEGNLANDLAAQPALAPNPENEALRNKERSLDAWIADLVKEDESRRAHLKKYAILKETAQRAAAASITSAIPTVPPMDQIPLDPTALLRPEDVLALGRSIRAAARATATKHQQHQQTPRKGPRASSVAAEDELESLDTLDVERELGISFANMRVQSANADMIAHRLENFVAGCASYTSLRQEMNHSAYEGLKGGQVDFTSPAQLISTSATSRQNTESLIARLATDSATDQIDILRAIARHG